MENRAARRRNQARSALGAILAILGTSALAEDLYCWEEPGTLRSFCVAPRKITSNGDLRASPVYMGGPKDVDPASITLVVNCKTGWSTMQDRRGVNVTGGPASSTQILAAEKDYLCAAKSPKQDRALRQ